MTSSIKSWKKRSGSHYGLKKRWHWSTEVVTWLFFPLIAPILQNHFILVSFDYMLHHVLSTFFSSQKFGLFLSLQVYQHVSMHEQLGVWVFNIFRIFLSFASNLVTFYLITFEYIRIVNHVYCKYENKCKIFSCNFMCFVSLSSIFSWQITAFS